MKYLVPDTSSLVSHKRKNFFKKIQSNLYHFGGRIILVITEIISFYCGILHSVQQPLKRLVLLKLFFLKKKTRHYTKTQFLETENALQLLRFKNILKIREDTLAFVKKWLAWKNPEYLNLLTHSWPMLPLYTPWCIIFTYTATTYQKRIFPCNFPKPSNNLFLKIALGNFNWNVFFSK